MKYVIIVLLTPICLLFAFFLLLAVSALFVNGKKEYGKNNRYYRFLLESSTALGLKILRVKVIKTGFDAVPRDSRFILVSNHRSNYDPIVTWHALRGYDVAFISKADNFKVPVWGRLIRRCGFLAIDRSSPRSSVETLNRAAEMVKSGDVSFGIYPEGTRSKTCRLLPFHNGTFLAAQKAGVPIVVIAVRGTEKIHKQYIKRRSDVYLDVLEVIPASEHMTMRTNDIGDRVRNDYENFLRGENNEQVLHPVQSQG